ncbi:chorismate synthase [Cytobacillus sp. Hz8]|uniref:chorismate synthase n=1 Tax=Cytobacillus sp. Hz8 TaxID=3347168 RepID=UPI0035E34156
MFNFFGTATERKRDEYYKLYMKLQDALQDHDKKVSEANASYSSYISTVPNLSQKDIPSNDFEPKREEKNALLNEYFNHDKEKRSSLVSAENKAYERYEYYRDLAIREAEERARSAKKK